MNKTKIISALAVFVLLLAGCGNSDSSGTKSNDATVSSSAESIDESMAEPDPEAFDLTDKNAVEVMKEATGKLDSLNGHINVNCYIDYDITPENGDTYNGEGQVWCDALVAGDKVSMSYDIDLDKAEQTAPEGYEQGHRLYRAYRDGDKLYHALGENDWKEVENNYIVEPNDSFDGFEGISVYENYEFYMITADLETLKNSNTAALPGVFTQITADLGDEGTANIYINKETMEFRKLIATGVKSPLIENLINAPDAEVTTSSDIYMVFDNWSGMTEEAIAIPTDLAKSLNENE